MNVLYYLPHEVAILEWKTNMHHVTLANGRRLIDIDAENVIPALQDLQQRLADLAETDNDDGCLHKLKLTSSCSSLPGADRHAWSTVFQLSATTGARASAAYQVCGRQLNYFRRFRAPKMRDRVGYMCGCLF